MAKEQKRFFCVAQRENVETHGDVKVVINPDLIRTLDHFDDDGTTISKTVLLFSSWSMVARFMQTTNDPALVPATFRDHAHLIECLEALPKPPNKLVMLNDVPGFAQGNRNNINTFIANLRGGVE